MMKLGKWGGGGGHLRGRWLAFRRVQLPKLYKLKVECQLVLASFLLAQEGDSHLCNLCITKSSKNSIS